MGPIGPMPLPIIPFAIGLKSRRSCRPLAWLPSLGPLAGPLLSPSSRWRFRGPVGIGCDGVAPKGMGMPASPEGVEVAVSEVAAYGMYDLVRSTLKRESMNGGPSNAVRLAAIRKRLGRVDAPFSRNSSSDDVRSFRRSASEISLSKRAAT